MTDMKHYNIFALQVDHLNADAQAKDWYKLKPGDRIPALMVVKSGAFLLFKIYNTIGNNGKYGYNSQWIRSDKLSNWFNLKLQQHKDGNRFMFEVLLDNYLLHTVENESPKVWKNVKVEFANVWPNTATGEYRNFKFVSNPPSSDLQGHSVRSSSDRWVILPDIDCYGGIIQRTPWVQSIQECISYWHWLLIRRKSLILSIIVTM